MHPHREAIENLDEAVVLAPRGRQVDGSEEAVGLGLEGPPERLAGSRDEDLAQLGGHALGAVAAVGERHQVQDTGRLVYPVRVPRPAVRPRLLLGLVLGPLLIGLAAPGAAGFAFDATRVQLGLRTVGSGFDLPLLVANAGDNSGRLFVVEQSGRVRILTAGPSGTPFLDVHSLIVQSSEQGLLGLAFHPGFATNGRLYVDYTRAGDGATIIDEYRVTTDPDVVSLATRRQIIAIPQPVTTNHKGGNISFGPDGFLYIGMGDGGGAGDPSGYAQDVNTLLGKMLRIDVNHTSAGKQYSIPSNNPYVGKVGLDEIFARGLRNPWRWSFDRQTHDLWIADVGQGQWEEIDRSTAVSGGGRGANFGWRILEGRHCFNPPSGCSNAGTVIPLIEYGHSVSGEANCAVTGGFVYRGARYPILRGGYVYADFCSGRIWVVDAAAPSPATGREVLNMSLMITSFGESQAGELYLTDIGGGIHQVIELTRYPGTGSF